MQAVRHFQGPCLIIASPGSGKTTVITHRTRYLIEECGVNPSNILVITFTKAAAGEMKERFNHLTQNQGYPVGFGTFHAIFFRILKYSYRYDASSIVREEQRIRYIKELIDNEDLEIEDENEFISAILSEISAVKGEMIKLDYYYSKNCPEEVFKRLYDGYEAKMRRANLIDFDDMMVMCYELFTQRKDILQAWQKKYQYILIDEFQDINKVQYEIVKMLAAPENNLFIVGDDDQSIYRFRGARPEIMLGFEKDYPGAKKIILNMNYRCCRPIVEAADRLIRCNKVRFPKDIDMIKQTGKPVVTKRWETPKEETLGIVKEIQDYLAGGYRMTDIAVLFRTSLEPRLLIEKCMEYNIPFKMKDSLPNLYNHWISQNILNYIKIASGSLERGRVLQIINRPNRYISRDSMETPVVSWEEMKSFYQDKGWMVERIEQLEYDLKMIGKMAPAAAVNYIRKAVGYDEYLRDYAQFRRMKPEELFEVADQLQESAGGFKTFEQWAEHIKEYGEQLVLQAQQREASVDGITLMTMHASKGLEFKVVYILDANEGITPHQKAVLDADIEEERRMFYVAMTRAKERLHIYYVKERYGKKQDGSRFIEEYTKREG
ncbi:AAA family ATPase [Clostridium sp. MCC353]|uniref:ATP-dependent helicase n=1 Tax=Clostridium sp. MCC353 TaxID=2592646 RepID=UPI001C02AA59|nr:ATP-dependent helicase [Clostridium sp. MCC353]MBT9775945.1 AAA family ATPase [Clostridium sp. MCC353]